MTDFSGVMTDTFRNQDGWTPLHMWSHQGNYDNVSMLLTYNADPNVQNSVCRGREKKEGRGREEQEPKITSFSSPFLFFSFLVGRMDGFTCRVSPGTLQVVKLLAKAGANLNVLSKQVRPSHLLLSFSLLHRPPLL